MWNRSSAPRTAALCAAVCFLASVNSLLAGANQPAPPNEAPALAEAPKVLLAYKFQPGQVVRYEVLHDGQITTVYNSAKEVAANKSESRRSFKVASVDEKGQALLEMQIEWVRMTASFENEEGRKSEPIEFDTSDPKKQNHAQFKKILQSVGKPQALVRIDASGRPIEVTRLDKASKKTEPAAASADIDGDGTPENYLVLLPEVPVAVGNTWKEPFEVVARLPQGLSSRIRMQRAYKLAELRQGLATIEFRTIILTPVQDAAIAAQLIQREVEGKIVFDTERGMIVSREAKVDRTVVGPFGGQSSMRAVSRYTERLLPDQVASRESTAPVAGP
jgi:hypothetical protein